MGCGGQAEGGGDYRWRRCGRLALAAVLPCAGCWHVRCILKGGQLAAGRLARGRRLHLGACAVAGAHGRRPAPSAPSPALRLPSALDFLFSGDLRPATCSKLEAECEASLLLSALATQRLFQRLPIVAPVCYLGLQPHCTPASHLRRRAATAPLRRLTRSVASPLLACHLNRRNQRATTRCRPMPASGADSPSTCRMSWIAPCLSPTPTAPISQVLFFPLFSPSPLASAEVEADLAPPPAKRWQTRSQEGPQKRRGRRQVARSSVAGRALFSRSFSRCLI